MAFVSGRLGMLLGHCRTTIDKIWAYLHCARLHQLFEATRQWHEKMCESLVGMSSTHCKFFSDNGMHPWYFLPSGVDDQADYRLSDIVDETCGAEPPPTCVFRIENRNQSSHLQRDSTNQCKCVCYVAITRHALTYSIVGCVPTLKSYRQRRAHAARTNYASLRMCCSFCGESSATMLRR